MQQREKQLTIALAVVACLVLVWYGMSALRGVFLGRLDDARLKNRLLDQAAQKLDDQELEVQIANRRMSDWNARSLPPNPIEAQRLYQAWLTDLGQLAGLSDLRVTPQSLQVTSTAFKGVQVSLKGQAAFEQITTFLHYFRQVDLLQRIAALKIEAPKNPGGRYGISLTAEGLCLPDAAPRTRLFARGRLADSMPRSFDSCKLASTDDFPKEPGFCVRIENEFLRVTAVEGNTWRVKRAVDGTAASRHPEKADVELFPVRYDRNDVTLDAERKVMASHPFTQPAPPPAQVADEARATRLMGSMVADDEQSAWLYNQTSKARTLIHKGSSISVADLQGTVVSIEPTFIQIKRGDDVWQLNIGQDLRSMRRIGGGGAGGDFDEGPGAEFMMDSEGGFPGGRDGGARDGRPPGEGGRPRVGGRGGRGARGGGGFRRPGGERTPGGERPGSRESANP